MKKISAACLALLISATAWGQPLPAITGIAYFPSWTARHHLQVLADDGELGLLLTHWPQPAAALAQALEKMPVARSTAQDRLEMARQFVLREIQAQTGQAQLTLSLRSRAESLNGFGDIDTPGSGMQLNSRTWQRASDRDAPAVAGRLGLRIEQQPASATRVLDGSRLPDVHASLEGSNWVVGLDGWNLQAFSHRFWWGPGWQDSLVLGTNAPAWHGVGLQRGSMQTSTHPWLSWMGPWNLEVFAAQARDPLVVAAQPRSYVFSGTRLTFKPRPWMELGFSRGLQFGGHGRPSGPIDFSKALLGMQVNKESADTFTDGSGQIAGYDARLSCPATWSTRLGGRCAAYTQWMGEDAAGKYPPLPYKFMSLWGAEHTLSEGRHRVFLEHTNTSAYSLPWEQNPQFPGYVNGVYSQGYTQQTRWAGSSLGGGSRMLTLGWMDAQFRQRLRLFSGRVGISPGIYNPTLADPPRGEAHGLAWDRGWTLRTMQLRTELAYLQLAQGTDTGSLKRHNLRLGLTLQYPLDGFNPPP